MVIKKETIQRIRDIINKHHNHVIISMVGRTALSPSQLRELRAQGINVDNESSILAETYYHNWLNEHGSTTAPTSYQDMKSQQRPSMLPIGEAHEVSIEHANASLLHVIEKQKGDVMSRIEGFIRDNNAAYKNNALQNLDRSEGLDKLIKENTIPQLKRKLRDYSRDASQRWDRIVHTEVSNAIGLGSTDRIVSDNRTKDLDEVYVYRIVQNDGALCKYCRRFYLDSDGSPKVYKLSTLLNNGSNYGRKADQWKPVTTATHPNERCSQVLELKPGWSVRSGGGQSYIGRKDWRDYIHDKVVG